MTRTDEEMIREALNEHKKRSRVYAIKLLNNMEEYGLIESFSYLRQNGRTVRKKAWRLIDD